MADVRFGLDLLRSGGFRHLAAHAPAACVRLECGVRTMIRHLFALLAIASGTVLGADAERWTLPIETRTLDNGLTVVVSEDHNSPTFGISVVYKVGMRLEPRDRTGFAHLFEHMMFEGTPNAPSGTFDKVVQGGGGILNGSTRADYTNYIASAPVSALEPILWLEADRMKTLDFSPVNLKNQQDVVKEEIRVNVKNQPYGIFFVLDMLGLVRRSREREAGGRGGLSPRLLRPRQRRDRHRGRSEGCRRVRVGREVLRRDRTAQDTAATGCGRRPQYGTASARSGRPAGARTRGRGGVEDAGPCERGPRTDGRARQSHGGR
jgi:hypothetical protein